jgi:Na+/phosphate symporter
MPIEIRSIWSLLIAVVGLVLYFAGSGKWSEAGRIMFSVGLLATLLFMGASRVSFGR